MLEQFGDVKVKFEGRPLMKVYVKCMCRYSDNSVRFHKDGYTDLRGTFNYAFLNDKSDSSIMDFSIYIKSNDHPAQIIRSIKLPKKMME